MWEPPDPFPSALTPPPPTGGGPRRRRSVTPKTVVRVLLLAVFLVLLAAGAHGVRIGNTRIRLAIFHGRSWVSAKGGAPRFPSAWDSRVKPIVDFVARERGLTYEHPVKVQFLTAADYSKQTRTKDSSLSAKDRKEMERTVGLLRAGGLVSGKVDLLGSQNQLKDQGTLAFYDAADQEVRVRGTDLTPDVRVTLAHELTHALQDQHFGILRHAASSNRAAADAFHALCEGDAERIEAKYAEQMSPADRQAYEATRAKQAKEADVSSVPPALVTFFSAPYVLGDELIALLERTGGNQAIDDAMQFPPSTEVQLLDPFRFLTHDSPRVVDTPKLHHGEKRLDDGPFGAISLYMVLAGRLDSHAALHAADAWDGDAEVDYKVKGRQCVRASFRSDSDESTDQLQSLLQQWTKAMPGASASVTRAGDVVTLQSCDPGEHAAKPSGAGVGPDVLVLPAARTTIALGFLQGGLSQSRARCAAGKAVDTLSVAQLKDDDPTHFENAAFFEQMRGFVAACPA